MEMLGLWASGLQTCKVIGNVHCDMRVNVTLPLNVSLDLGLMCGTQHDLAMIDTDFLLVTCYDESQGLKTLGRKAISNCRRVTSRKGDRALMSRGRWKMSGDSRRPS